MHADPKHTTRLLKPNESIRWNETPNWKVVSLSVRQPLRTNQEAEAAIICIERWSPCEERADRLIEIAALRLEYLWKKFGRSKECLPRGSELMLILDTKRMFAVNANMDRPSRARQAEDLEQDRLINWHRELFYALLTCDFIMGSVANADLFRATMLDRFSSEGTSASMPHEYMCVKLGSAKKLLLEHLSTPGHRARNVAAELDRSTSIARSTPPSRRI